MLFQVIGGFLGTLVTGRWGNDGCFLEILYEWVGVLENDVVICSYSYTAAYFSIIRLDASGYRIGRIGRS